MHGSQTFTRGSQLRSGSLSLSPMPALPTVLRALAKKLWLLLQLSGYRCYYYLLGCLRREIANSTPSDTGSLSVAFLWLPQPSCLAAYAVRLRIRRLRIRAALVWHFCGSSLRANRAWLPTPRDCEFDAFGYGQPCFSPSVVTSACGQMFLAFVAVSECVRHDVTVQVSRSDRWVRKNCRRPMLSYFLQLSIVIVVLAPQSSSCRFVVGFLA